MMTDKYFTESLRNMAQDGDPHAMVDLAFALQTQRIGDRSMKLDGLPIGEANYWFFHAAEAGQPEACFQWAMNLLSGQKRYRDGSMAATYLRRAADAGHALASLHLGFLLRRGDGVPIDEAGAASYISRAAHSGVTTDCGNAVFDPLASLSSDDPWRWAQIMFGLDYSDRIAFKACRTAAESGIVAAFERLADCHFRGAGTKKDKKEGLLWYQRAAEAGDIEAQSRLGFLLATGYDVPKNPTEALRWLHLAIEAGHAGAAYTLGVIERDGLAGPASPEDAAKWFTLAVERGHVPTISALMDLRRKNQVQLTNPVDIATLVSIAREEDEATGRWSEARDKFLQAAEMGSGFAAWQLGFYYQYGRPGIEADIHAAEHWLGEAANRGHQLAMQNYFLFCLHGHGRTRDMQEAEAWCERLLPSTTHDAILLADHLLFKSRNGPWDLARAIYWYRRAAELGNKHAWTRLGLMALDGYGLNRDMKAAAYLFKHAAEAGESEAAYQLGCLYRDGKGVKHSTPMAIKWFEKAGSGHHDAVKSLTALTVNT